MSTHLVTVGACILGEVRGRSPIPPNLPPAERLRLLRVDEIERLIRHRRDVHGVLPDDAALIALLDHGVDTGSVRYWRPETGPSDWARLLNTSAGRKWTASALGRHLGLDRDERAALDIKTIRFVGQTATDQAEAKRSRDRARRAMERAADGAMPRQQWLSDKGETTRLAERYGVSRRTIERWRARGIVPTECRKYVADIGSTSMGDQPATSHEQNEIARAIKARRTGGAR